MKRGLLSLLLVLFAINASAATRMVDLRDVSALQSWFKGNDQNVRIIVLLSPSCMSCREGFQGIQTILKNVPDKNLKAAVVWLPVAKEDNRATAESVSTGFSDSRLTYFWDPYRAAGETWQTVLSGMKGSVWDVYLLYEKKADWPADPSVPGFWMHQLQDVPYAPRFDAGIFEEKTKAFLKEK